MEIELTDLSPRNKWSQKDEKIGGYCYYVSDGYWINDSGGARYLNESTQTLWMKQLAIAFAAPIIHPIAWGLMLTKLAVKTVLFLALGVLALFGDKQAQDYVKKNALSFLKEWGELLLIKPLLVGSAYLSVLYGVLSPWLALLSHPLSRLWTSDSLDQRTLDMLRDARKLYASSERGLYGMSMVAPCFQPKAKDQIDTPCVPNAFFGGQEHLLGGHGANAW